MKAVITAVLLATTGVAVASEPCYKVLPAPAASVQAPKKAQQRGNKVVKPRKAVPAAKRQQVQCDPTASATGQNKFIAAATEPVVESRMVPSTHGLPSALEQLERAERKPEEGMRTAERREDDRPVYAQSGKAWDMLVPGMYGAGFMYANGAFCDTSRPSHHVNVETKPRPPHGKPDGEVPIPGTMFLVGLGIFLVGRLTLKGGAK